MITPPQKKGQNRFSDNMPVIPASEELEAERLQIQDQPGQFSKTLSQKKKFFLRAGYVGSALV